MLQLQVVVESVLVARAEWLWYVDTRRCCGAVWSGIAAGGTTKHWVTRAATDCVLNAGTKTRPDLWRLGSRALSVDMTPRTCIANERVNRLSRVDCHHRSDWLLPVCNYLSLTLRQQKHLCSVLNSLHLERFIKYLVKFIFIRFLYTSIAIINGEIMTFIFNACYLAVTTKN